MLNKKTGISAETQNFLEEIKTIPTNSSFQDFVKSVNEALSKWQSSFGIQQDLQLRFVDFFSSVKDGNEDSKRVPPELEQYCLEQIGEMFHEYQAYLKSKLSSSEDDPILRFKLETTFVHKDLNISINLNPRLLSASIDKNGNLVFYPNFTLENINGSKRNSDYMQSIFEQFLRKFHDANISCEDSRPLVTQDRNLSNFTNLSTIIDFKEISRIYNETGRISRQDQQQLKNIYEYFRNILENPTQILQVKQDQADRLQAIISLTKFSPLQHRINPSSDIILFDNKAKYQSSLTIDHENFKSFFKFLEDNLALRGFIDAMSQQGGEIVTNLARNYSSSSISRADDFEEILPFDKFLLEMTRQLSIRYGMGQERFALILQYSEISDLDLRNQSRNAWLREICRETGLRAIERSSSRYAETTSPFDPHPPTDGVKYTIYGSSSLTYGPSSSTPLPQFTQSSSYMQSSSNGNNNTTQTDDSSLSSIYFSSLGQTADFSTSLPKDSSRVFDKFTTSALQNPAFNATNKSVYITQPANGTFSQAPLSRDQDSYLDIFRRKLQRDILCIELPSATARAVSMILSSYSSLDETQQESVNSIVEQLSRFIAVAVVRSPESAGVGLAVGQLISSGQKIPQIKKYIENFDKFKDSLAVKCVNDSWEKIPAIVRNFSTHLAFASVYYLAISGYESLIKNNELDSEHTGGSDSSQKVLQEVLYATLISTASSAMNAVARYVGDTFSKKIHEIVEEEVGGCVEADMRFGNQRRLGRETGGVEVSSRPPTSLNLSESGKDSLGTRQASPSASALNPRVVEGNNAAQKTGTVFV